MKAVKRAARMVGVAAVLAAMLATGAFGGWQPRAEAALFISDVKVVSGSSSSVSCGSGWEKINNDLNAGAGGKYIYLCVQRRASESVWGTNHLWGGEWVDELHVVSGSTWSGPQCGSGYKKIEKDLNEGAGGAYVFFCVKYTSDFGKGLSGVAFFTFARSTPRWIAESSAKTGCNGSTGNLDLTDINEGAGGKYIFLCRWG